VEVTLPDFPCLAHCVGRLFGPSALTESIARCRDVETMALGWIYVERILTDLSVQEGWKARMWLTHVHEEAECALDHIGACVRLLEEQRASFEGEAGSNQANSLLTICTPRTSYLCSEFAERHTRLMRGA
jgi:hypothetical protein